MLTTSEAGLPVIGFGTIPLAFKLFDEFNDEFSFLPRLEIVKCKGSLPSRRIISGSMRLRALINQLQTFNLVNQKLTNIFYNKYRIKQHTCSTVKLASCDSVNFSASLGYAL